MNWQVIGDRLAPVLTIAFGLGAILCAIGLYATYRAARATTFGYVGEQAAARKKQLWVAIIVLVLLTAATGGLWEISMRQPDILPTSIPTATRTLVPTPTPRTPTPTFTPTSTPTITPTPTKTPIPPDAHLPPALRTPFPEQAAEASPDAALVELVLASGEKDSVPVNPATQFPAATQQVYAFFTFTAMERNVPWVHVWYYKSGDQLKEVWSAVELWNHEKGGRTWRYLNCTPGQYELHVYIDHQLQQKILFTIGGE